MYNWFDKRSTTNLLLLGIVILLAAHLILNLPIIPTAKAQVVKTTQEDYLKSIDKSISDIKVNTDTMRTNLSIIMDCTRNTPTGDKAIAVKNVGIQ